ncbi:MAG: helix-turn-helix domain-containing protein [Candidatus Brocadiia bacterium]
MSEWLTAADLADRLQVTVETITAWRQAGLIPAVQITGKTIRFDLAEVERSLRARGQRSAGAPAPAKGCGDAA